MQKNVAKLRPLVSALFTKHCPSTSITPNAAHLLKCFGLLLSAVGWSRCIGWACEALVSIKAFFLYFGKFWRKKVCARFFVKSNELCIQLLQLRTDLDEIFRNYSPKLGLIQF